MTALLILAVLTVSPGQPVNLSTTADGRAARLLSGERLESAYQPSILPRLDVVDAMRFVDEGPPAPLDGGGGIDREGREIVALLLGLIVGFGTGHLVAHDQNGFVLFLVIDIAIIFTTFVVGAIVHLEVLGVLGSLGLVISHIIQGLDAYGKAGGQRIIERERSHSIEIAGRSSPDAIPVHSAFTVAF